MNYIDMMIASFLALITTFFVTFAIKKIALKLNVVDIPNHRKIHTKPTPLLGGLAIFIGFFVGLLYLRPMHDHYFVIMLGAIVIIITGILDDKYDLRPVVKFGGQVLAASFLISSGLIIERFTFPFIGVVDLGVFSVIITILWVVGITNAVNFMDGLDGLATGISTIAISTMLIMAIVDMQMFAAYLCVVLIGANIGFLYHNFYPAKIYMGDTGSNFLGYMIAVISILGLFKNIALLGFVIPVVILAVPIFDTLFAIIRRVRNKQSISQPDNKHIHYQLMRVGLTHRQSVLVMYAFSLIFGIIAILFAKTSYTITFIVLIIALILVHILAEIAGLVLNGKRPVVDFILKVFGMQKKDKKLNGDN